MSFAATPIASIATARSGAATIQADGLVDAFLASLPALPLYAAVLTGLFVGVVVAAGRIAGSSAPTGSRPGWATASERALESPLTWILIVAWTFLVANQMLVRQLGTPLWDADSQFVPYFTLVADFARAGRLLAWDPWSNGGLPLLGDPQVGASSPLLIAIAGITGGGVGGFLVWWLLVWGAGGLGLFLLGRHLRAPLWGAAAVSIAFLFCGVYTGHAEHTSWIIGFSAVPFVIWRLDVALSRSSALPALQAGAIWGLSALGGYPGLVVLTGLLCAFWAFGRSIWGFPEQGENRDMGPAGIPIRTALLYVTIVAVVGSVVLAPTYFSFFFEGAGSNPRAGSLDRATVLFGGLSPGTFTTFASPYITTVKAVAQVGGFAAPWPTVDLSMVNVYAGPLLPALALLALVADPRAGWRWYLAGGVALAAGMSMSELLPLRGWLYDYFPPTRYFRHSGIFRLYALFLCAVLALKGAGDLDAALVHGRAGVIRRFVGSTVVLGALALGTLGAFLATVRVESVPSLASVAAAAHGAVVWLGCTGIALLGLFLVSSPGAESRGARRVKGRPTVLIPTLLILLVAADAGATSVLSSPTMLSYGAGVRRWNALEARHVRSLDLAAGGLHRIVSDCPVQLPERCRRNDQMVTKVPVLNANASERNPFLLGMLASRVLTDAVTGEDRIWFSESATEVDATEAVFPQFLALADSLGAPPLFVHVPERLLRRVATVPELPLSAGGIDPWPADVSPAVRVRSRVIHYTPDRLELEVEVPADGWLLVTDRWGRSWRASVDGTQVPLYVANFLFRAVQVTGGARRVSFRFQPAGFPWIHLLSWVVLGSVLIVSVAPYSPHGMRSILRTR